MIDFECKYKALLSATAKYMDTVGEMEGVYFLDYGARHGYTKEEWEEILNAMQICDPEYHDRLRQ